MCRLCNLFSPSHSQLLDHCTQLHLQQGLPEDIIVILQPLAAQPEGIAAETPPKRKRGRPKGSTNKRKKDDSQDYTEVSAETENEKEKKDKEQDENDAETMGLECKACHRTFSNRRQIIKHICLKDVEEDGDEEEDDSGSSELPKTTKRRQQLTEDQISQTKEESMSSASKKSVVKVFLTEDKTIPDVSKMVPVEESTIDEESVSAEATPLSHPEVTESEAADPSDNPQTDQGSSLKPTTETNKGFQEYSIKQDATSSLQSHLKIFACEFCNKIFKFRHSLIAHLRTHTHEKPFKCPHCDYASAIKANLNVHLRKHTGDKFHCEHCSFTCLSSGHLKVHIERVHLKVKHHCSFCKCKYSDIKNLLKHMEKHHNLKDATVNKVYQELRLKTRQGFRQLLFHCPTCKRCFKSRQERERHLLVHGPQRPFGCMLCDYGATKLSGLSAHVRKHFFVYVCCVCNSMFVSCPKLKTHLSESHPELDQEQAFTECIQCSFQLIQPGATWGQETEKTQHQADRDEEIRQDLQSNGEDEVQKSGTNEETEQNQNQTSLEIEQKMGMHLESEASSQSCKNKLCQTSLENSTLTVAENKTIISTNLLEATQSSKNKEHALKVLSPDISEVCDQKQDNQLTPSKTSETTDALQFSNVTLPTPPIPVEDDRASQAKKKSEVTFENAFLKVLSSIQKTQLNMEALQQLRKIYGDMECQYCGKLFSYKVHYNIHVRTHTKEHMQYCAQCNYSSVTKSSLNRHMIQKHSDLMLSCPNADCKFTTPDKYKLQTHVRRYHEVAKTVSCPVCNKSYPEHRLKQHIRKIHPDTVPAEGKGRMEKRADKCPYCDSYFLKNSNDFQQHIWAHQGVKPYTCNMCDYAGCRKSNLKLHMNRHKTEKSHLCDLCGKKFKSKLTLKSHSLSHTNEGKRFKCPECDFASALKTSLLRHMELHGASKAFQCAHCFYSCNNVGPLKRHYKKKHPDQKYPDAEDDSSTESQEEQETLKCPVCDSVYGTKWELNSHLKNQHRLNVLEIAFEEGETVETQYVPAEDEVQLTEVPVETLQDSEAVNILQQIELNSETHNVVTPMVAMAPGTVSVIEQIADEQVIGNEQLMVVNADEDLAADQVMVVEEAEGLEALTVLTQGDDTHHYIVYVQEQTVEIN